VDVWGSVVGNRQPSISQRRQRVHRAVQRGARCRQPYNFCNAEVPRNVLPLLLDSGEEEEQTME